MMSSGYRETFIIKLGGSLFSLRRELQPRTFASSTSSFVSKSQIISDDFSSSWVVDVSQGTIAMLAGPL